MNETDCGTTKKESPIERELKHLQGALNELKAGAAGLSVKLTPVLMQPEPSLENKTATKGSGGTDCNSGLLRTLETFSREIVGTSRKIDDISNRLQI